MEVGQVHCHTRGRELYKSVHIRGWRMFGVFGQSGRWVWMMREKNHVQVYQGPSVRSRRRSQSEYETRQGKKREPEEAETEEEEEEEKEEKEEENTGLAGIGLNVSVELRVFILGPNHDHWRLVGRSGRRGHKFLKNSSHVRSQRLTEGIEAVFELGASHQLSCLSMLLLR